jgi:hypothetical protein
MALQKALHLLHALQHVPLVDMALQKALQLLHALDCAPLERIIAMRGRQPAHHVPLVDMALQKALQLLHALQHVLLVIHALLAQLIYTEELLQPALVLAVSYAPRDIHVQLLLVALCQ